MANDPEPMTAPTPAALGYRLPAGWEPHAATWLGWPRNRDDRPVVVFLGAWAALLTVSGLAVLVGRALLQRIRLTTLYYLGALVCLALATFTAYEILAS